MGTNKPKLQGYIERSLFDQFETERQSWQLTQSQALEKILSERYIKKSILDEKSQLGLEDRLKRLEETVNKLDNAFNELSPDIKSRLWLVECHLGVTSQDNLPEITNDTGDDLLKITSNTKDDSLKITSDIQSEPVKITSDTGGNSLEITSDIQSELVEITSDIQSESVEITSDTASDLLEITSDIRSELVEITSDTVSDSPGITSDIGNDSPEITSDIQSDPVEITSDISTSHRYFDHFLVCELRKDGLVDYWAEDGGLTPDIRQAKVYEHKRYAEAQLRKLQAGLSPAIANNIKLATARTRLEAEIGLNKIPYSLRQIFDYWEKQELRRISKRKSKGQKGKSEITE